MGDEKGMTEGVLKILHVYYRDSCPGDNDQYSNRLKLGFRIQDIVLP